MNDRMRTLADEAAELYRQGSRTEAIERWEQVLALVEPTDSVSISQYQNRLSVAYREVGRWDKARVAGRTALSCAQQTGRPDLIILSAGHLGDVQMLRGAFDEAERCFSEASVLAERHRIDQASVGLARRRAELAMLREESAAMALAQKASQLAQQKGAHTEAARSLAIEAVALARSGKYAEIDPLLEKATAAVRQGGSPAELAEIRLLSAHAWLAAGRPADALAQSNRAAVYADEVGLPRLRMQAEALKTRARAALHADHRDQGLERLLDLAAAMPLMRDPLTLLDAIAESALELLRGDRSFVLLREGGETRVVAARSKQAGDPGEPSMSVVQRAISEKREVIATDLDERGDLRSAVSITALGLRSILCVPMVDGRDVLGAVYVDSQTASQQDFTEAVRLARALSAHAAVAVGNARRTREAKEQAERSRTFFQELHDPLITLLTLAQNLEEAREDPEWHLELANGISSMGQALLNRIAAETSSKEDWQPVNLGMLLDEVLASISWDARRKGVSLQTEIDGHSWVIGDADALGRALTAVLTYVLSKSFKGGAWSVRLSQEVDEVAIAISGGQDLSLEASMSHDAPLARRVFADHGGRWTADADTQWIRLPLAVGV